VSEYKYIMNIPLSKTFYLALLIFPLVLFLLLLQKRNNKILISNETIVLSLAALLSLRTAYFRTDDSHILASTFPSLIAITIIAFFCLNEKGKKILLALSLVA